MECPSVELECQVLCGLGLRSQSEEKWDDVHRFCELSLMAFLRCVCLASCGDMVRNNV